MPLVLIQYRSSDLVSIVRQLAQQMPRIVAPALDASEQDGDVASLLPGDVEVWCVESGGSDVNVKDIEIIIWAHDFPSRKENLDERMKKILEGAKEVICGFRCGKLLTGYVWVLLQPTAYGTF